MKHGSLFSGIGGFDLAAEWMGWENVFHCEWNEFGQKILKYYWPDAINYGDITKTDFTIHRGTIDILTGGFPCQPFSMAGKRKGTEDERYLWPEMLRTIREIKPGWVVGENVSGILSWDGGLVFEQVQADLEVEGYEVWPYVLPACAVNAPHRRDRVWFIAHDNKFNGNRTGFCSGKIPQHKATSLRSKSNADPKIKRHQRANTEGSICTKGRPSKLFNVDKITSDTESTGREGANGIQQPIRFKPGTWDNWPTVEPPVCSRNDGVPGGLAGITFSKHRNESIKAYGNAIVPQIALQIFKAIEQYENC